MELSSYCNDWCGTTTCFRNFKHLQEATLTGGVLEQFPDTVITFLVAPPLDCTIRTPKEP